MEVRAYFSLAFPQITYIFNSDWPAVQHIQNSYLFSSPKKPQQLCNEQVQIKMFSLRFFSIKILKKPTNLHTTCISLFLSSSSHSLGFLFNEYLSYSPQSCSFCSYFFVTGCPPSCHMHISLCLASLASYRLSSFPIVFPHSSLLHLLSLPPHH